MKNSSASHPQTETNRETALGFLAANMAVPGTGTFLSGRRIAGSIQTLIGLAGMGVTLVLGARMVIWMLANWGRLQDPYGDPSELLREIWFASRWPLAGIAAFALAWTWAVTDSLRLVRKTAPRKPTSAPL